MIRARALGGSFMRIWRGRSRSGVARCGDDGLVKMIGMLACIISTKSKYVTIES